MTVNHSLWDFFANAGPVVKLVMLILLAASIISWTFIFQRWSFLSKLQRQLRRFERKFADSDNLNELYKTFSQKNRAEGIAAVFVAGFKDYSHLYRSGRLAATNPSLESVRSAMVVQQNRLNESLEAHLSFLATVASTSPYIGLFGTVWGIMTAFSALGSVQQASIAMVAPGISEALIATAMGLFAAIPAAIAYNRFSYRVELILNRIDIFIEDFVRILGQQESK